MSRFKWGAYINSPTWRVLPPLFRPPTYVPHAHILITVTQRHYQRKASAHETSHRFQKHEAAFNTQSSFGTNRVRRHWGQDEVGSTIQLFSSKRDIVPSGCVFSFALAREPSYIFCVLSINRYNQSPTSSSIPSTSG